MAKTASSTVWSPSDAKPASPRTTGNTEDQNRLKPCRGRLFDLWKSWNWKVRAGRENLDSGVIGVSACRRPRWPPDRREHEQTTAPEPHPGIQGEGGTGRRHGRADAGGIGAAI